MNKKLLALNMESKSRRFTKKILLGSPGLLPITILITLLSGFSSSAQASGILDIARDFVNKIDKIYSEVIQISPLEQIPDGGTLLLKPRSQKIFYSDDIYAIKKNDKLYLSFDDVINILEFSIDFNKSDDTAEGWFIREDWKFQADFKGPPPGGPFFLGRLISSLVNFRRIPNI